jgi:hypothetical protein
VKRNQAAKKGMQTKRQNGCIAQRFAKHAGADVAQMVRLAALRALMIDWR